MCFLNLKSVKNWILKNKQLFENRQKLCYYFYMKIEKTKDRIVIKKEDTFDLKDTFECGQIFSYVLLSENFYLVNSNDKFAKVFSENNDIIIETDETDYFYDFFDLGTDYKKIIKDIEKHKNFSQYTGFGRGIRILKQQPFQTIMSFIISSNNNIKRIKKILQSLCLKYGTKTNLGHAFPTLDQFKHASAADFLKLGAGYRSEYLKKTIEMLQTPEFDIDKLKTLKTEELREKLLKLSGVGPKVCDCIMLFGFSKTDVFPVDTWIRKGFYLFETQKKSDKQIAQYFVDIFKENSGYAQQYLYNYMLNGNLSVENPAKS